VVLSPQANYTVGSIVTCYRNLMPTFVDRGVSRGQRGENPTAINLSSLDWNINNNNNHHHHLSGLVVRVIDYRPRALIRVSQK
jgi:hypothetical protein